MKSRFQNRLAALDAAGQVSLGGGRKGIEKESLRVDAEGQLSRTPHPASLGSALSNQYITTDFSESLLEFVTPAYSNTWEALREVCDLHQFTYANLDKELLWVSSMPCGIPEDNEIPLARYGSSNVGQMKTVYRRGLGHRYGRHMQTIAGVHFNYSLPESFWPAYQQLREDKQTQEAFRSEHYMGLVRNFRRTGWILLYLFGASPALCKSFGRGETLNMESLNEHTWYEPYGTSLRMSDLGYNNQSQARINISLDNIDDYIRDLSAATRTPEPDFEAIGVKVDGKYQQLNANQLQIENEYYSPIRPKRVANSGERPTAALSRGGVEYVEIRSLDINLFDPCGINQNTMRFVEAYLVYCLLDKSPLLDDRELQETKQNQALTARRGRDPSLLLLRGGEELPMMIWAREIIENVQSVAELIDRDEGGDSYVSAVAAMGALVADPEATPSARILHELRTEKSSFFEFALSIARGHRDYFAAIAELPAERQQFLEEEARISLQRQLEIETSDSIDFDEYLSNYFASD